MNVYAASALTQNSKDFQALQNSLQTGNLVGAQQAFAAFQQDMQKTSQVAGPSSIFAPGTQANQDLQAVAGALRSANLSGAQKAFATLLQDIQSAAGPASTAVAAARGPHPLTPAEVASNGVATSSTHALGSLTGQSVSQILSSKI